MEAFYEIVDPIKTELERCVLEATEYLNRAKTCTSNEEKLELVAKSQKAAEVAREVFTDAEATIFSFVGADDEINVKISEFHMGLQDIVLQLQSAEEELKMISPEHANDAATNQHNAVSLTETPNMLSDGETVVTSNRPTEIITWRHFLEENWDQLMVKDTIVLVLTGVHGLSNGEIGKVDESLATEDEKQKEILLRNHCQDITANNIKFIVLDIGPIVEEHYFKNHNLENLKRALAENINTREAQNDMDGMKFTFLFLSYCHTQNHVVTDLLRLNSMCSRLILERDLFELYGRRISWSEEQMSALKWVTENPGRLVLLTGDYGTGKTVLATEAVKIKVAHYRTMKRVPVQVVVSAGYGNISHFTHSSSYKIPETLQAYLEKIFAAWRVEVKVLTMEESMTKSSIVETDLLPLLERMRKHKKKHYKMRTIFFLDEVPSRMVHPWPENMLQEEEDLVIAIQPPKQEALNGLGLPKCLVLSRNYRNSFQINRLCRFIVSHFETSGDESIGLANYGMERAESDYPVGSLPVWVTIDKGVTEEEAVGYLQRQPDYEDRLQSGQFQVVSPVIEKNWKVRGAEWPTVVVTDLQQERFSNTYSLCEAITRAKSHLFIITGVKMESAQLMRRAVEHSQITQDCQMCSQSNNEEISFIGKLLLERAWGGRTLTKVNGQLE